MPEKGIHCVRCLGKPPAEELWNGKGRTSCSRSHPSLWLIRLELVFFLHFFVSLIHHLPGIGICHTILICVKLVFIFDICSSVTHSIKFAFALHAECNNFSTVSLFELQISLKGAFEWINIPGRVPPWQSCKIPQNMIKLYQIPAPTEIPLNLWPCWAENTK